VELDIAQADFARLTPTQKGIVTTDAYPDKQYDGQIAQISPEANRQKATVQVKVQVLNPNKYSDVQLRPEMNATVRFLANDPPKDAKAPTGVFVPSTAIRDRDGKKIVLIAYNGKAVAREIQITSQRADGAVVDGLVGGENVITTAPATLKDGDRIKVKGQS
jgi:HlyD family secretion protein